MQTSQELAAGLVNTASLPAGLANVQLLAAEAEAYDRLCPYPDYHFRDWKTEDRGPLPRCMPIAKGIVARGARWLFGRHLQLHVARNPALETFLRRAWEQNRMPARLVAMARRAAIEGGIVLKFSYDGAAKIPLSIQSLSLTKECRLYYHPHDREQLLMARIQYPYQDAATGKTWWYREEWTDEEMISYEPVAAETISSGSSIGIAANRSLSPDGYQAWQITDRRPNPFGVIPVAHIKNLETDDVWGAGDLWELYRVLDRIHLTYHLMDKSNQFDSEPLPLFIDLDVDEQDIDKPLQPGQPMQLESREGEHQGKVQQLEARGSLRPAMMEYARDLRKQVFSAASAVEIDQAEFSNKGNLTTAVLQQLFQPQIEITNEKRKSYGDYGIVPFLKTVAYGLQHAGIPLGITDDAESHDVQIQWPAYFEMSQDELTTLTGRTQQQVNAGFLTQERAVERVAQAEGVTDVAALAEELGTHPIPSQREGATQ
jgi:hypothetical protein